MFDFNSLVSYVNGIPLPFLTNDDFMKEVKDMELREDDIFIATYPKSGTHWMQEIVHLILVDGHGEKLNSSHRRPIFELTDVTLKTKEEIYAAGPILRQIAKDPSPRVITTHVPYTLLPKQLNDKPCKLIYVYRHPKDVIVSFYNFFSRQFGMDNLENVHPSRDFANFFDTTVAGKFQYGSWFDHVRGYYKHSGDHYLFPVSYETMKKDLRKVVTDLAVFIGRQIDQAAVNRVVECASFQSMKEAYRKDRFENIKLGKKVFDSSFYHHKGTIGQWRDVFTSDQNKYFDEVFGEGMKNCEWTKPYVLDEIAPVRTCLQCDKLTM